MRRRSVKKSLGGKNLQNPKSKLSSRTPIKKCLKCGARIPAKSHVMSAVFCKKSKPKVIHFCCLDCMEQFDFDIYGKLN